MSNFKSDRFGFGYVYDHLCLEDNGQPLIEVKGNSEEKELLLEVLNEMDKENRLLKQKLYDVDKLSVKRDDDLYNLKLLQRFKYIDSKVHGRRCPSLIRDYLTMHDYMDLDELELLLNSLYTQCRVNDLLKNEIIDLRLERVNLLKRINQK